MNRRVSLARATVGRIRDRECNRRVGKVCWMLRVSTRLGLWGDRFAVEHTEFRVAQVSDKQMQTGHGWYVRTLLRHDESMA